MSKYYVYLHRTLCGKVFYVGKGTGYRMKMVEELNSRGAEYTSRHIYQ